MAQPSSGMALLRWKFSEEMNVELPSLQPGGWSAHGQPQETHAQHIACVFPLVMHSELCHLYLSLSIIIEGINKEVTLKVHPIDSEVL